MALLLLQKDSDVRSLIEQREGQRAARALQIAETTRGRFSQPLAYLIARQQREAARQILQSALTLPTQRVSGFAERLSAAIITPLTGIPILVLSLFLLYQFVGVFGAQTLVDFLEEGVFGSYINPWVDQALLSYIPWPIVRELFGGQYGVITLGCAMRWPSSCPLWALFSWPFP